MKLVMTLLVRDEEDVLAANFECHLSQGVDFFIVTDNLSVDGSREIIERYVRGGVAVCLDECSDNFAQARWVTKMARIAATRYGADWVINGDADEFWVGKSPADGIKPELAAVGKTVPHVTVERSNFVPVDEEGVGFFAERMTLRERRSYNAVGGLLPPKVCHRARADIEVDQGNHSIRCAGTELTGESCSLRILHYPVRSYRQLENKIVKGGAAYARNAELPYETGRTWRHLYSEWQADRLREYYSQVMRRPHAVARDLQSGELIYDGTLLDILRHRALEKARSPRDGA